MSKDLDSPDQVRRSGSIINVDLWYPQIEGHANVIEVGLSDVRAADNIRIRYDFERDGYVIEQDAYENTERGLDAVGEWAEVAFIQAWGRERPAR